MAWPAIAAVAGAVLGGIAGGQKDTTGGFSDSQSQSDVKLKNFEDLNKGRSELEKRGYDESLAQFNDLTKLLGLGPGAGEVSANTQFQNSFAGNLENLLKGLSNPDVAKNYAESNALFAPEREALKQNFQDQTTESNRMAARMGRSGIDPILRNKLSQEQTRQTRSLDAQVGSYGRQLPMINAQNYLQIGGALSNLRAGLATQALQNRSTLLGLGNSLAESERNYRLNTALRTGSQTNVGEQYSGGGTKGAINGGMAGMSSFMGAFGGMGGGGGAAGGGGGGMAPTMR